MSGLLKALFGPRRQPVLEVVHPILGTLAYDRASESWSKTVTVGGQAFRFSVGGELEPDPKLLEQAALVQAQLPSLVADLATFLEKEAVTQPALAAEIRSLKLEDVAVWWPKEPDAVMLWFKGPSQERIWHCSFTNRTISDLVYDC